MCACVCVCVHKHTQISMTSVTARRQKKTAINEFCKAHPPEYERETGQLHGTEVERAAAPPASLGSEPSKDK